MGGGGGNSGTVAFPGFAEDRFQAWADYNGTVTMNTSLVDELNRAMSSANNPYTGKTPYDVSTRVAALVGAVDDYKTGADSLSSGLGTLVAEIMSTQYIEDEIAAWTAIYDADLASNTYPRFEIGMRDLNAVDTSAYTIGRALIEDARDRDVAKFSSDLWLQQRTALGLQMVSTALEHQKGAAGMQVEANRISMIAEKEEHQQTLEYEVMDLTWPLEVFKTGQNYLALAMSGGVIPPDMRPPKEMTALGGAMSGAAAGGSAAGPYGAIAGALIGGAVGYYSGR